MGQLNADVIIGGNRQNVSFDVAFNEMHEAGYTYGGEITPESEPSDTQRQLFFFAKAVGTYRNYGGIAVNRGEMAFIYKKDYRWVKDYWDINDLLDGKTDKVLGAASGNFAGLDAHGNLIDSGRKHSDYATAAQGAKADKAYQQAAVNATDIAALQEAYQGLTQNDVVVVADHTAVTSPQANTIYREYGETSYSDWMYSDNAWVKMAEYDNAVDDDPTLASDNLVKSGGVYKCAKDGGVICYNTEKTTDIDTNYFVPKGTKFFEYVPKVEGAVDLEVPIYPIYNASSLLTYCDANYSLPDTFETFVYRVEPSQDMTDKSRFFSNPVVIDGIDDGNLACAFPSMFRYGSTIYCVYTYGVPHAANAYNWNLRYKYSLDGGSTWLPNNSRIELVLPQGNATNYEREYKIAYFFEAGDRLFAIGWIQMGHKEGSSYVPQAAKSFIAEFTMNNDHTLSYVSNSMHIIPQISRSGVVYDPLDDDSDQPETGVGSNIVGGKPMIVDGYLYWNIYNSNRDAIVCKCSLEDILEGDVTKDTVSIVSIIKDVASYSEGVMFYNGAEIIIGLRNDTVGHVFDIYAIDMESENDMYSNYTLKSSPGACQGPDCVVVGDLAYFVGRSKDAAIKGKTRTDNITVVSKHGHYVTDDIKYWHHAAYDDDSAYAAVLAGEDEMLIAYYYTKAQSSDYCIEITSIPNDELTYLNY